MLISAVAGLLAFVFLFAIRDRGPRGLQKPPLPSAYGTIIACFAVYGALPMALRLYAGPTGFTWVSWTHPDSVNLLASAAILASLMSFIAGYRLPSLSRRRPQIRATTAAGPPRTSIMPQWHPLAIPVFLVFAGLLLKMAAIREAGGLEDTLLRMSQGVAGVVGLDGASTAVVRLRALSGIADAAATWLLLMALDRRRHRGAATLVFGLVVLFTYVSIGKRLFLFWPLAAAMAGVHFYLIPLRLRLLPLALCGALAAGFGTLMFRIYAPLQVVGGTLNLSDVPWANGSIANLYLGSVEFASFDLIGLIIYEGNEINALLGGWLQALYRTNIEPLAYGIPSFIWPTKPEVFVDYSHALAVYLFGGSLQQPTFGVAATLIGTSYALLGFGGMIAVMTGLGVVAARIDMSFVHSRPSPRSIACYALLLMLLFHAFRQGTIGWTLIVTGFQQFGLVMGIAILYISDPAQRLASVQRRMRARPMVTSSSAGNAHRLP